MRFSISRTELTILATSLITLIALALAPAWWGAAFGQESNTAQSQNSTSPNRIKTIGDGQWATIESVFHVEPASNSILVLERCRENSLTTCPKR
jgi:hypothetical protein